MATLILPASVNSLTSQRVHFPFQRVHFTSKGYIFSPKGYIVPLKGYIFPWMINFTLRTLYDLRIIRKVFVLLWMSVFLRVAHFFGIRHWSHLQFVSFMRSSVSLTTMLILKQKRKLCCISSLKHKVSHTGKTFHSHNPSLDQTDGVARLINSATSLCSLWLFNCR